MAYTIYKSDGSIFVTLDDGQLDTSNTSLTLVGKRVTNYGQYENTNLVRLLENFANNTEPPNPIAGQTWFDKTNDILRLKVYNGTTWKSLPNFTLSTSTPTLNTGDLWWDSSNEILYIKTTATTAIIGGPNVNATSASKLNVARNINNVPFDGTSDITISSTASNYLIFGDYINGNDFNGSTTTTISVDVGTVSEPTPIKVVARDSNGDIWFRIGYGTATASRYADLAEKYLADIEYDVGTVVVIGGPKEVTKSQQGQRALGVVSANPGLIMNEGLENGTLIALKGRVPVKIQGHVSKGQRLIAGHNGSAVGVDTAHPDVFAIALEDSQNKDTIEAVIL